MMVMANVTPVLKASMARTEDESEGVFLFAY
jgi:hypothetical protein